MRVPFNKIIDCLEIKADWIGVREVSCQSATLSARNAHSEQSNFAVDQGVMIEVLQDGQFGYASTYSLDMQSIRSTAQQALLMAKIGSPYKVAHFTQNQRPNHQKEDSLLQKTQPLLFSDKLPQIEEKLIELSAYLKKSPPIINAMVMALVTQMEQRYASTSGSSITQNFQFISPFMKVTAAKGNIIQTRTLNGHFAHSYQGSLAGLDEIINRENADQVVADVLELLSAEPCPSGDLDLVLAPDQMMLQIHESIGHPLEIDRILGDERNFAGSSFVKVSDFGFLHYGSPMMNVSFDPNVSGEFATYEFDDIGQRAKPEKIIQRGLLLRGLGGLESQWRSGLPGVANLRASNWNRPAIDRIGNLNLDPGSSSQEEILGAVENGVLMMTNRSWSIDDCRNKFQFGCEMGKLIRKGKIIRTVRDPNYRGETVPFWNRLALVGNAATMKVYGTPYCGKGEPSQLARVGHGAPLCLFRDIEVFGGV